MSTNVDKIIQFKSLNKSPKKALRCRLCKDAVYVGDEYYAINRVPFCKECVSKKIAEDFDIEGYLEDLYQKEEQP